MSQELTDREGREMMLFLEDVRSGTGPLNAGIAVGWSPAQVRRKLKDPEFSQLFSDAKEMLHESIEATLYRLADAGNVKCIQMVLYNERADRWKDVRHIEVERNDTLDVGVVLSVKQAAVELLRENGIDGMQTAIEATAVEK